MPPEATSSLTPTPSDPVVSAQDVDQQIRALKRMRQEATWWRYGALAVMAATVVYSISALRSSALALTEPGPAQTEFTTTLGKGLERDVLPNVQQIASQTLTEMRPQVEASFTKLNARAPEVAQASLTEFGALQKNLPERSEKILNETFSAELEKREAKIKQMFPEATEENVQSLVDNLAAAGQKRMPTIMDNLMGKHVDAVNGIMQDVLTIHGQEKVSPNQDTATWEMTLAVVDLVRDDLRELAPADAKTPSGPAGKAAKPAAATPAKKEAKL